MIENPQIIVVHQAVRRSEAAGDVNWRAQPELLQFGGAHVLGPDDFRVAPVFGRISSKSGSAAVDFGTRNELTSMVCSGPSG